MSSARSAAYRVELTDQNHAPLFHNPALDTLFTIKKRGKSVSASCPNHGPDLRPLNMGGKMANQPQAQMRLQIPLRDRNRLTATNAGPNVNQKVTPLHQPLCFQHA